MFVFSRQPFQYALKTPDPVWPANPQSVDLRQFVKVKAVTIIIIIILTLVTIISQNE